jgi:hypothetical protein
VVNAVNMLGAEAFADETAYYGRSVGEVLASQPPPEYRAGMQVLDLADPAAPRLLVHRNWSPPFGGGTHTALPLPAREVLVVADEGLADNCADQVMYTWVSGVRAFDLADPFAPREVGVFVPAAPERPYDTRPDRPRVIQSCDVFVNRDGVMYVTDYNAGLYVLRYEPGAA